MSGQALRAADVDRERVADRLRRAHTEGRISLAEFDERIAAAYAAVTYDELAPLTVDLPELRAAAAAGTAGEPGVGGRRCGSSRGRAVAFRIESAAWLFASLVNLVIWALVSVGAGAAAYPWWIWVAGPWGMVLLLRRIAPRRYAGR